MDPRVPKNVERTGMAVCKFNANTKKSVARLDSVSNVRARIESLEKYWNAFVEAWDEWLDVDDIEKNKMGDTAFDDEFYDGVDMEYALAKGALYAMIEALTPATVQQVPNAAGAAAEGPQHNVFKLQAVVPPSFSGEWEEWMSFRDMFRSIVMNNNSISDMQRLQLLRVACKGEAGEAIEGIELVAGNFQTAWDILVTKYENERLIITRLIEQMLNLPAMTRECSTELAKLVNGTKKCLRSMAVLERPTDDWSDLLVVITTRKLDHDTRMLWERSINSTTAMPTFKQLEDYLHSTLRSFEGMKNITASTSGSGVGNNGRRVAHAHVVHATEQPNNSCLSCQGDHGLFKCPEFLGKSVAERRAFIEGGRICFNCISTTRHLARFCTSKYRCRECNNRHHTLLHVTESQLASTHQPSPQTVSTQQATVGHPSGPRATPFDTLRNSSSNVCHAHEGNPLETLTPTAWLTVTSVEGRSMKLRALIDQGSQTAILSRRAAKQLGMSWQPITPEEMEVTGVGESCAGTPDGAVYFSATAYNREGGVKLGVRAWVMKAVTADLPNVTLQPSNDPKIASLQLADERYWQRGRIDVLLGANLFYEILLTGVYKADGLVAQETIFGWMLTGTAVARSHLTANVLCTQVVRSELPLDGLLQRFWEQEEMPRHTQMSTEDEMCESIYLRTTKRGLDGRYTVELPFRQGGRELGESEKGAVRRLMQMEKKGIQHEKMYEGYKQFMATYLRLGHMERIPANEIGRQPHCYLPHHAVFKPDSTTTKLRVVFDATAATANGKGLNALLLTGPRLQETLPTILTRWRKHKIGISADIEKMYRQIWVDPAHCEFQRIVWRDSPSEEIGHYRLKTVTYGTSSAPYMAVKTIQRLADDEEQRFPTAANVVRSDFYVDDCMSGANSVDEAVKLKDELLALMNAGGLRLLKWSSNSRELLQTIPDDHIECRSPLEIDGDDSIKALGIHWHPASDEFSYKVQRSEGKEAETKREILSEIAKLFDPLGMLAPVIITAKTMMQQLWLTGLGWDETLPIEVREKWCEFQRQLAQLEEIRIKRWFGYSGQHQSIQLHGFSDASILAYAACVYVRVQLNDGTVMVTLLMSKTKVAPIKQLSVPRLELNGAVLLARLLTECRQTMRCGELETFAWTDSTVVLAWLQRHANVWPTFIANRVGEIQSTMNSTQWQHVPGPENPADVASRGIMPSEIRAHPLWWTGPSWLREKRENWPTKQQLEVDDELLEQKKVVSCAMVQKINVESLAKRVSTWRKLLRLTAYCRRMLPGRRVDGRVLHANEIEEARRTWLRFAQTAEYGNVDKFVRNGPALRKNRLQKMRPFVDDHGLMRVGGRLGNANLTYDEQHPVIVPRSDVSRLLILDAHARVYHSGPQNTRAYLRQQYWLVNERRQVRGLVHKCITCAKANPRAQAQVMGDLPAARVQAARPFTHTAVDYAGPIMTRTTRGRGQRAHKSWIAVFVCLSSKAVHLELVSELSAAAFIAAFRRFTSRRGLCSDVYADNGTNFVGADREMRQQLHECMHDDEWRTILGESGTRFHFAPPRSPHFNGLAEATVRMAKTALRKVIGETKLTFEEMSTFLAQVEAALNSRPLCELSSDSNDLNALTPGHFLTGQPILAVPQPSSLHEKLSLSHRWHLIQQMTQHFWHRWAKEYLHQLHQRNKWQTVERDLKVGDMVVISDEMVHCTRWKMGRIVETHPGADGHVRVVSVRTATGIMKRAVTKVCLLPIENVSNGDADADDATDEAILDGASTTTD